MFLISANVNLQIVFALSRYKTVQPGIDLRTTHKDRQFLIILSIWELPSACSLTSGRAQFLCRHSTNFEYYWKIIVTVWVGSFFIAHLGI